MEIMPKCHRYPLTKFGPSFIQEPTMLTQTPQRSASLKFPTQIPLILPTLALTFPIYFKSEAAQYARHFTNCLLLFTSSVQLYAN